LVSCQVKRGLPYKGNCWVPVREWTPNSRSANYSNISVNFNEHTLWNTAKGINDYCYSHMTTKRQMSWIWSRLTQVLPRMLVQIKEWVPNDMCSLTLNSRYTGPKFARTQSFRFLCLGTLKTPSEFRSNWKRNDTSPQQFIFCLSRHLQPPRDLWNGATFQRSDMSMRAFVKV